MAELRNFLLSDLGGLVDIAIFVAVIKLLTL